MCRLQSAFRAPIVVWIKFSRSIFFCFKVQVHKAELHCQYFKVQFFSLGSSKSEFIFTHLYFWSPFRSANLCTFLTTLESGIFSLWRHGDHWHVPGHWGQLLTNLNMAMLRKFLLHLRWVCHVTLVKFPKALVVYSTFLLVGLDSFKVCLIQS